MKKIIVITGPTASGKTALAIKLARKFDGEIISADSRQVYRGLDIGSGKDLADYASGGRAIKYHLIDVASPKTDFTAGRYQKMTNRVIADILARKKLPIIVGGSGLYISAVVKNYDFPVITKKKLKEIRQKLDKKTLPQLLVWLKKVDKKSFASLDHNNRRYIQRALEIYLSTGQAKSVRRATTKEQYDYLVLGLDVEEKKLKQNIKKRLLYRLEKEGLIAEVKKLKKSGLSWKRLDSFGLEYRFVARYLQKQLTYQQLVERLSHEIGQFAKRQKTWWRKEGGVVWVQNYTQAANLINPFLKK